LSNIEIRQDDFQAAGLPANSFSFISVVATLHHRNAEAALRRLRELLRPGGEVLVVGIPHLTSHADFRWANLERPRARLIGTLKHEHWPSDVPTASSQESIRETQVIVSRVLPGARVKRSGYYRYVLRWREPK
jgi:SAM-dependent methyltransferase